MGPNIVCSKRCYQGSPGRLKPFDVPSQLLFIILAIKTWPTVGSLATHEAGTRRRQGMVMEAYPTECVEPGAPEPRSKLVRLWSGEHPTADIVFVRVGWLG